VNATEMKREREEEVTKKQVRVNAPDHCTHCEEEPCVFIQIESRLCGNDSIYNDKDEYHKGIMWCIIVEGINVRTSTQRSSSGRGLTTTSHTSPVLMMAFVVRFSLPSMA
jgi:hypothetical protein